MIKKRRKLGLSTQINLIFTAITLITSLLFIIIFRNAISNFTNTHADRHLIAYHDSVVDVLESGSRLPATYYYLSIVFQNDKDEVYKEIKTNDTFKVDQLLLDEIIGLFLEKRTDKPVDYIPINNKEVIKKGEYYYIVEQLKFKYPGLEEAVYLISISNGSYAKTFNEPISNVLSLGFVAIIILGNAIILLWTSLMVERIKKLQEEVVLLNSSHYENKIVTSGNDEISDLAHAIDDMRMEIYNNEAVKTEMLQNISHDIKTPIAVIRSYAEAIQDGISDISEVDIIIKQSEILTRKVKQLLDWNKLEYIKDTKDYKEINMSDIINNVANNHKYRNDVEIILDLDDSYYFGIVDNYYSMINNIVENGLRYAKSKIIITLKNKKITIFNDGEPISEDFLKGSFKPYEKGHKGQFGLGMIIVQRTVTSFNLKLTITNLSNGVEFVIEPKL